MNPIYKFELSVEQDTRRVYPVYKDDLAIDYALETGEQFYRGTLSGKLTFQKDDYQYIRTRAFDTQFGLKILRSNDGGATWTQYWDGQFWKTDCVINEDDKTVIVTPTLKDRYVDVLAGLDKEYNLIDLAPAIQKISMYKRPMIEIYIPGQSVVGCFLSGLWWEQECDIVTNENDLVNTYHFYPCSNQCVVKVTQTGTPTIPNVFTGESWEIGEYGSKTYVNSQYGFLYSFMGGAGGNQTRWSIFRVSDNVEMWNLVVNNQIPPVAPYSVTLNPVSETGATGTVTLDIKNIAIYARLVTDMETADGQNTYPMPVPDMVPETRNYSRVIGIDLGDTIGFFTEYSTTPTKWGLYKSGLYYKEPVSQTVRKWYPVGRAAWDDISIWFAYSQYNWLIDTKWRKEFTLKDSYPIWSVISVLLGQIAPSVSHAGTTAYSQFLYGINPISNIDARLFITPKSNLIASGYDQPAQKAPITLKIVLNMLRDCFRCYWFIDEQNRFRVEHIQYFRNGGSYSGTPVVGVDLTKARVSRNGKPWAFAKNQYEFDKPEMAARYQFGWMDNVFELFEGSPIDIVSKYVNPNNIEQISVEQFTSDVDYILANPSQISQDGFALLAAMLVDGEYKLPVVTFYIDTIEYRLQNGYLTFEYLQRYYLYDMPAPKYKIRGITFTAQGIKKLKRQTLKFPVINEPNFMNLIKTGLGNGTIQKMSVNLSSRNANTTLMYDTE